jgi:hypothetical protein
MAQIEAPNVFGQFLEGQKAGQEQRRRRTLADFLQPALGGDQNALSQVYAADPDAGLQVQGMVQKQQAASREQQVADLKQAASLYRAAPEPMKAQLYGKIVEGVEGLGLAQAGSLPRTHNPEFDAGFNQFLDAIAGNEQQRNIAVAPGSAIVDPQTGRVVYERPFAPANMQPITTDQGYAAFNPKTGTAEPLNYGSAIGQPSNNYQDLYADIAARNGSQVTSGIRPVLPGVGAGANSQHPKGTAADFRTNGLQPQQVAALMGDLRNQGFEVIDERDNRNGRGPHIHAELPPGGRRVMPAQKEQAPSALQERIAAAQAMGASEDDIRRMVIGREGAAAGAKPLPTQALSQLLSVEDALAGARGVAAIIQKHANRMTSGELSVSPQGAIGAKLRTAIGQANPNDVNMSEFNADKTRIVNESLRLNAGVQTEGDAQRAGQELMAADDQATAARALRRLAEINRRAVDLQKKKQAVIRKNYGQDADGNPLGQQQAAPAGDDDDALIGKYL